MWARLPWPHATTCFMRQTSFPTITAHTPSAILSFARIPQLNYEATIADLLSLTARAWQHPCLSI